MRRLSAKAVLAAAVILGTLVVSPSVASAAGPLGGRELDARAVATPIGTNSLAHSFFSGTVSPGASKSWFWNNAGTNIAFKIGLSPTGASTSSACQFEVTNQWYERVSTGERKFGFTIKNTGSLACGTNILISFVSASVIASTGGMEPGEVKSFFAVSDQLGATIAPLLGLVPSGATSANNCRFKVTRTWFQRLHQGDVATPVFLRYDVQNIGSIACSADVERGEASVDARLAWRTLNPGASVTTTWRNANPTTATHVIGVDPQEIGCEMEVTRSWYRQVIDSNGATERQLQLTLRNVGSFQCTARPTLARI